MSDNPLVAVARLQAARGAGDLPVPPIPWFGLPLTAAVLAAMLALARSGPELQDFGPLVALNYANTLLLLVLSLGIMHLRIGETWHLVRLVQGLEGLPVSRASLLDGLATERLRGVLRLLLSNLPGLALVLLAWPWRPLALVVLLALAAAGIAVYTTLAVARWHPAEVPLVLVGGGLIALVLLADGDEWTVVLGAFAAVAVARALALLPLRFPTRAAARRKRRPCEDAWLWRFGDRPAGAGLLAAAAMAWAAALWWPSQTEAVLVVFAFAAATLAWIQAQDVVAPERLEPLVGTRMEGREVAAASMTVVCRSVQWPAMLLVAIPLAAMGDALLAAGVVYLAIPMGAAGGLASEERPSPLQIALGMLFYVDFLLAGAVVVWALVAMLWWQAGGGGDPSFRAIAYPLGLYCLWLAGRPDGPVRALERRFRPG